VLKVSNYGQRPDILIMAYGDFLYSLAASDEVGPAIMTEALRHVRHKGGGREARVIVSGYQNPGL
jgi:hypothetical protein